MCPEDIATADNKIAPFEVTGKETTIPWTYSVFWKEEKKISWANRWDLYLLSSDPQIHWYSIVNSLIIVLFLTAMVAIIMLRTLNKDIALYNEEDLKVRYFELIRSRISVTVLMDPIGCLGGTAGRHDGMEARTRRCVQVP